MKSILRCLLRGRGVGFRDHLGSKIGVSERLGASWRRLGASWKRLGQRLEASCRICRVLERLGARLGVVSPFSGGPEGFERQVRGSLPVALARGAPKIFPGLFGVPVLLGPPWQPISAL